MDERQQLRELEKESDEIKAEVIVLWHRVRRFGETLSELRGEAEERRSQSSIERYRDELPSETKFSLHPTGMRLFLKNARPSTFVVVVIVLGVIVLTWLLRSR